MLGSFVFWGMIFIISFFSFAVSTCKVCEEQQHIEFGMGNKKNVKRYSVLTLIFVLLSICSGVIAIHIIENKESTTAKRESTTEKTEISDSIETTYKTIVIDGTEYKLVPSGK